MKQYFKIGEIAELFDLNIRTLRYYDQIDLVKPEFTDPSSGYRYYSTAQFEPLNTIRYLRDLGMSLDDIRSFLRGRDTGAMQDMMRAQLEEVNQRQRDLDLIRRKLQTRLAQIEKATTGPQGTVEFHRFDARQAVRLRYSLAPDTDLEYPIRLLAKDIGVRGVFLGMVGLSISRQRLESAEFDNYDSIFLLLDGETTSETAGGPQSDAAGGQRPGTAGGLQSDAAGGPQSDTVGDPLPGTASSRAEFAAGEYAVLRFRGTHAAAAGHYQTLHDEIRRKGYKICGDSLEITLIDYGLTCDPENFVTELQIPVRKD